MLVLRAQVEVQICQPQVGLQVGEEDQDQTRRIQGQGDRAQHQVADLGAHLLLQGEQQHLPLVSDGKIHPDAQAGGGNDQQQGRVLLWLLPQALTFAVIKTIFPFGTELSTSLLS